MPYLCYSREEVEECLHRAKDYLPNITFRNHSPLIVEIFLRNSPIGTIRDVDPKGNDHFWCPDKTYQSRYGSLITQRCKDWLLEGRSLGEPEIDQKSLEPVQDEIRTSLLEKFAVTNFPEAILRPVTHPPGTVYRHQYWTTRDLNQKVSDPGILPRVEFRPESQGRIRIQVNDIYVGDLVRAADKPQESSREYHYRTDSHKFPHTYGDIHIFEDGDTILRNQHGERIDFDPTVAKKSVVRHIHWHHAAREKNT